MTDKTDSKTPLTDEFARSGDASAEDWTDFARSLELRLIQTQNEAKISDEDNERYIIKLIHSELTAALAAQPKEKP